MNDWNRDLNTGNWWLREAGRVIAIVHPRADGWRGVWRSVAGDRFTARAYPSAGGAREAVDGGIAGGSSSPVWKPVSRSWRLSKAKRGFDADGRTTLRMGFWRRGEGGRVLSVRQVGNGKWIASEMGRPVDWLDALLGEPLTDDENSILWFRTAADAAAEMDLRYPGGGALPIPEEEGDEAPRPLPVVSAADPEDLSDVFEQLDLLETR